jgi:hypothetical protein
MFDIDHSHEHPHVYHAVHSFHFYFNDETLNDKPKKQEYSCLTDKSSCPNGIPSMTHNVINPSQYIFLQHAKTRFDIDNHVFDHYFCVL